MEHGRANPRQLELFGAETPPTPIPPERRLRLVPLIGILLTEAASIPTAAKETDHEDHA